MKIGVHAVIDQQNQFITNNSNIKSMEAKMQIAVEGTYDLDKFNEAISSLESLGWKVNRQYGGTMPTMKGHGASLSKNLL